MGTRGTLPALPGISKFYLIKNFVKVHHTNETTLGSLIQAMDVISIMALKKGMK